MQRLVAEKEKNPKNDLISDAIKQQVRLKVRIFQFAKHLCRLPSLL
jgi:hypothetical protein